MILEMHIQRQYEAQSMKSSHQRAYGLITLIQIVFTKLRAYIYRENQRANQTCPFGRSGSERRRRSVRCGVSQQRTTFRKSRFSSFDRKRISLRCRQFKGSPLVDYVFDRLLKEENAVSSPRIFKTVIPACIEICQGMLK